MRGSPDQKLILTKGSVFGCQKFADVVVEFVEENGQITALKQIDPSECAAVGIAFLDFSTPVNY